MPTTSNIKVRIDAVGIVGVDIKVGIPVVEIVVSFFVWIIVFYSQDCSSQDKWPTRIFICFKIQN
jgi:hypothetical protein